MGIVERLVAAAAPLSEESHAIEADVRARPQPSYPKAPPDANGPVSL